MSTTVNITAQVLGALLVVGTLWSAMLTVVVPRAERPRITRYHYKFIGLISRTVHRWVRDPEARNTFDSRLAPFGLITLSFVGQHILLSVLLLSSGGKVCAAR